MISKIDRKRIFIFVAIAFGLYIGSYLVVYLGGEQFSSFRNAASPQADALRAGLMFAPLIAREGWSNTLLRLDFRGVRVILFTILKIVMSRQLKIQVDIVTSIVNGLNVIQHIFNKGENHEYSNHFTDATQTLRSA